MDQIVTNQADAETTGSRVTAVAARTLRVSRSGYYDWKRRMPSTRDRENAALAQAIGRVYAESDEIYGAKKVQAELRDADVANYDVRWARVGKNRVARLMRVQGLRGISRCRAFTVTTERAKPPRERPAPDLVNRRFVAEGPNQLWVADITYIRLADVFVYLAVVLDAFSRRIVGWELGPGLGADLVLSALRQALSARTLNGDIVHHSDRGVQYCCGEYVKVLEEHGFTISMSRRGNPWDNAKCESFMKTLKVEEVYLKQYRDIDDARANLTVFLDEVYNGQRLHSALQYHSPEAFELALAAPAVAVRNEATA